MQQAGLIQYAERRSTYQRNPCSLSEIKYTNNRQPVALRLVDLFTVFFVFCARIGLGVVSFLAELVAGRLQSGAEITRPRHCV